jgi:hypothetical protein
MPEIGGFGMSEGRLTELRKMGNGLKYYAELARDWLEDEENDGVRKFLEYLCSDLVDSIVDVQNIEKEALK